MIIDVHCHCTYTRRVAQAGRRFSFEPAEENGRAALDSCIAPRCLRRPTWRLTNRLFGFAPRLAAGAELDEILAKFYEVHFFADGPIERIVLLAFDAYHDDDGHRPPPPEKRDQFGSDIYTSNSFVYDTCRQRPERFLFGASVHPYRENAVGCVEEVFEHGACLLKWIPLHQNIDVADPRTLAVLRCCARLGLPVLVHYSQEFTLATQHPEYQPVAALLDVLRRLRREGTMPITIVAHVATPVTPLGERRSHAALVDALLGEFADAPLYADISALTSWGKVGFLRKTARRQDLHAKLVFGTDFPIPVALPRLRRDLGREHARIKAEPSWIQQAGYIYRRMGFNEIVFHRAAELLPNVSYFTEQTAALTA
ncbi:MAG: amidohydrolase family protein [Phycisphaerae bacterium]